MRALSWSSAPPDNVTDSFKESPQDSRQHSPFEKTVKCPDDEHLEVRRQSREERVVLQDIPAHEVNSCHPDGDDKEDYGSSVPVFFLVHGNVVVKEFRTQPCVH